jgi:hypothetical protein
MKSPPGFRHVALCSYRFDFWRDKKKKKKPVAETHGKTELCWHVSALKLNNSGREKKREITRETGTVTNVHWMKTVKSEPTVSLFPIKVQSTRCLSMRPLVCTLQNLLKTRSFLSCQNQPAGKIRKDNKSDTQSHSTGMFQRLVCLRL